MHIQINLDTDNITDGDRAILALLMGPTAQIEATVTKLAAAPAPVEDSPADEAPAEKPEPRKRAPRKAAAAKEAPATEEPTGPTLEDAVAAASKLIKAEKGEAVKAALDVVGAARVSEIAPKQIAAFLAELPDDDSE